MCIRDSNSITAAQSGHTFIYRRTETHTSGNPLAHAILRGATNKHGNAIPNYHFEDLELLLEKYEHAGLKNPAAIVDTNHSNSNKKYEQQPRICLLYTSSGHISNLPLPRLR